MKLKLIRPLIFFDLETTHKEIDIAKIVELAAIKLNVDGSTISMRRRYNPGIPIPEGASLVHKIYDQDVEDCIFLKDDVETILEFFHGCDIAGYNSNKFDIPILARELEELGYDLLSPGIKTIDVLNIFVRKEDRKLTSALKFYTGRTLENAHAADADTQATVDVFLAQLERYDDLPGNIDELALYSNFDKLPSIDREGKFIYSDTGEPIFAFGKYKDELCVHNQDYLVWMEGPSSTFSPHVKTVAKNIRLGKYDIV